MHLHNIMSMHLHVRGVHLGPHIGTGSGALYHSITEAVSTEYSMQGHGVHDTQHAHTNPPCQRAADKHMVVCMGIIKDIVAQSRFHLYLTRSHNQVLLLR